MAMNEEMMAKLKAKNLSLDAELVAEKLTHARVLMDNIRLQQKQKNFVEGNKKLCGSWLQKKLRGK